VRFASTIQITLIGLGVSSLCSVGLGAVIPAFIFIFGELFNIFVTQTPDEIRKSSQIVAGKKKEKKKEKKIQIVRANFNYSAIFVGIAVYNLVMSYFGTLLWVKILIQ
jgi:hypothetical protein